VRNKSFRAGLSHKTNILEELKVNASERGIILTHQCQYFCSGELFGLDHFQECTRINKTRLHCRVDVP